MYAREGVLHELPSTAYSCLAATTPLTRLPFNHSLLSILQKATFPLQPTDSHE